VEKADKVNDYIKLGFQREEDRVVFKATVVDEHDLPWEATRQIQNWQSLRDNSKNSASSMFSLDYMDDIAPMIPSENFWLHIGQNYPCIMEFGMGETGQCTYMQAPRIESE
jgi:hypothetical protein